MPPFLVGDLLINDRGPYGLEDFTSFNDIVASERNLVIETPIVEATLQRALASGGEFADVFVEDRSSTSATYDDGKVEEMRSGRSRGAGIRVVRGETTGFAQTSDLTADVAGGRAKQDHVDRPEHRVER